MNDHPFDTFLVTEAAPGVKVVSYRTERFKTAQLALHLVLPLRGDVSEYIILPYLLSRSCAVYPDYLSLNRRLAELYGAELHPSVSKHGENLILRLSMTTIDSRFALSGEDILLECADLLCQVLFAPHLEGGVLAAADVEREKRLRLETLESAKNDKRAYALHRCLTIMCEDEDYRVDTLGTREGLTALTPETVTEAWKRALSTARVQLNVVGSGDVDAITARVLSGLSRFPRTDLMTIGTDVVETAKGPVKRVEEDENVRQGKLVLGYRAGMEAPGDNYAAVRTMVDLFGGGTYSRCFMNVREKQSLCYYCSARLLGQKGIVYVQSGIEDENAEKAIEEIGKQLQDLADGHVTEEDLRNSRRSLSDGYRSVSDTPEELDGWAYLQICEPVFHTLEELVEQLQSVTPEQVVEAAKRVTLDTIFLLHGTGEGEDE